MNTNWSGVRTFVSRHRRSIKDLSLLLAFVLVAGFIASQIDIFATEGRQT